MAINKAKNSERKRKWQNVDNFLPIVCIPLTNIIYCNGRGKSDSTFTN